MAGCLKTGCLEGSLDGIAVMPGNIVIGNECSTPDKASLSYQGARIADAALFDNDVIGASGKVDGDLGHDESSAGRFWTRWVRLARNYEGLRAFHRERSGWSSRSSGLSERLRVVTRWSSRRAEAVAS